MTLTVARVGPFSTAVHALRAGDRLWLRGPLGQPFTLPPVDPSAARSPLLFVGGGYGVAPLHFLAECARLSDWTVSMVIGARTAADVIFGERFKALGVPVSITTDDGSAGMRGSATTALEAILDEDNTGVTVYASGPTPMLRRVIDLASLYEVDCQLSVERIMACGVGACHGCVLKALDEEGEPTYLRACKEGPVFNSRRIISL